MESKLLPPKKEEFVAWGFWKRRFVTTTGRKGRRNQPDQQDWKAWGHSAALGDGESRALQQLGRGHTRPRVVGWSVRREQAGAGSEISQWRAMLGLQGGSLGQGAVLWFGGIDRIFPGKGSKQVHVSRKNGCLLSDFRMCGGALG